MEVVEVEVKGGGDHRFVRISIDKPEGVTHGDCELISQQVGTILDVEDVVPGGHYTLEVSSPGVERKLSSRRTTSGFRGRRPRSSLQRADRPADAPWRARWPASPEGDIALETAPGQTMRVALRSSAEGQSEVRVVSRPG